MSPLTLLELTFPLWQSYIISTMLCSSARYRHQGFPCKQPNIQIRPNSVRAFYFPALHHTGRWHASLPCVATAPMTSRRLHTRRDPSRQHWRSARESHIGTPQTSCTSVPTVTWSTFRCRYGRSTVPPSGSGSYRTAGSRCSTKRQELRVYCFWLLSQLSLPSLCGR